MIDEQKAVAGETEKQKRSAAIPVSVVLCGLVYFISTRFDLLEWFAEFSRKHESWELDEFATVALFLVFLLTFFLFRQWKEAQKSNELLAQRNLDLQQAFSEIKQLRGILPICTSCKKVKNDKGYWQLVEEYVRDHSDAEFSHGLCPECAKKLYPEYIE